MIQQRHVLLLLSILILLPLSATSQLRFRVAGGLSTDWITNDNPATYRLAGSGDELDTNAGFGGGFDGVQMGWGLKGFADIDKQKIYRVPFGFDMWSYSGTQSLNATNYNVTVRHDVTLYSGSIGFEWSFVEFPLAYARAYLGAEGRVTHVGPNTITTKGQTRIDSNRVINYETVSDGKPPATRIGAMARLGIEGEIYYPVFLNTSVAWGVMNLIGRDMTPTVDGGRGELLTPRSFNETGESLVYHLNFTFMIQVRI